MGGSPSKLTEILKKRFSACAPAYCELDLQVREAPAAYRNTPVEAETLGVAREFVRRVSAAHSVKTAILFGSRARGTHRADSDVDLAVVLRGQRGKLVDTSLEMGDIAFDVLLETNIYIQPLPIWEDEWDRPETHSNPRLLENIRREGLAL